ncbi:MAG: UDP-N-acetylmuramate dehydrogenase [Pseudomonadota bacterium]
MVLAALPEVRGQLTPQFELSKLSWLKVGGPAEVLFQPADLDDLAGFLAAYDGPVFPIGVASNLIIRDGGIDGVVVKLGRGFNQIETLEGGLVRAGAAALDAHVARKAADAGIDLTFLRTIPGAMGGAVKMNAGCYGTYTADVVQEVDLILRDGTPKTLTADEIGFAYRTSDLPDGAIITSVLLKGPIGDAAALHAKMEAQLVKRAESQPVKELSCGSTFANPAGFSSTGEVDDPMDLKAWKLIDDAGMRGAIVGGAQMSEMHSNFMINVGWATAADLEELGELVRKKVFKNSQIELNWEIMRVGKPPQK